MAKKYILVVVESQAKTKIIEQYLGPEYRCVSTFGHLRELKNISDINFEDIENTQYSIINTSQNLNKIAILKDAVHNSKEVIIATDDDREGESIGWHFCKLFNLYAKCSFNSSNMSSPSICHIKTLIAIKSLFVKSNHSPFFLFSLK